MHNSACMNCIGERQLGNDYVPFSSGLVVGGLLPELYRFCAHRCLHAACLTTRCYGLCHHAESFSGWLKIVDHSRTPITSLMSRRQVAVF